MPHYTITKQSQTLKFTIKSSVCGVYNATLYNIYAKSHFKIPNQIISLRVCNAIHILFGIFAFDNMYRYKSKFIFMGVNIQGGAYSVTITKLKPSQNVKSSTQNSIQWYPKSIPIQNLILTQRTLYF